MVSYPQREVALLLHWMNDVDRAYAIGSAYACQIMNVEAGDRRRDDLAAPIEHRMMDQGDGYFWHFRVCGGSEGRAVTPLCDPVHRTLAMRAASPVLLFAAHR